MNKIAIIGFGRIGSVLGAYLSNFKQNLVYGIDINKNLINSFYSQKEIFNEPGIFKLIKKSLINKKLILSNDLRNIQKCNYILICVGTPLKKNSKSVDNGYLKKCISQIEKYLNSRKTVILKSSVVPGTTSSLFKKIYKKKKFKFAYCPERLAEGTALNDIKNNKLLISGYDKNSLDKISNFWSSVKIKTLKLQTPEEAEITKLATNSWIDLNIAFANEIARTIDHLKFDVDIMNVIKAANTLKKGSSFINILLPSLGVGGYCLTKDPIFLNREKSKKEKYSLILEARKINNDMPEYCARRILNVISKRKIKNQKMLILGATYKGNTDDIRETPVFKFIKVLKKNKFKNIFIYDEYIKLNDRKLFDCSFSDNLKFSLRNSNILVIAANHDYINRSTPEIIEKYFKKNGIVFDGRRYFSDKDKSKIKNNKFNYIGIGRS